MPRSPIAYAPELVETIVTYIRAGAYPEVAAEAAGVPRAVFRRWLLQGEGRRATEPYVSFARRIRQAKAQARVLAENILYKKDPRTWLKSGPGKENLGNPGWSKDVSAVPRNTRRERRLLAHPHWQRLWAALLLALAPFPEARQAVVRALKSSDEP